MKYRRQGVSLAALATLLASTGAYAADAAPNSGAVQNEAQQNADPQSTPPQAAASPADPARNAESQGSASQSEVADIIVVANKREQSINDVGLAITALDASTLQNRRVSTLDDLAAAVPGLSFATSANNTPIFTIRGIGFYETSLAAYPAVSSYLDEVPLPIPILTTLTAFDLERVEVLKGPQGTLFGQNSTGGAINYIAAKPTNQMSAGGSLSYGRFNAIEGTAFISGPLSSTLKFRLAGRVAYSDDWQYSYTRNDSIGKTRNYAARLLLDWEPTDRIRFKLNLNGWLDKSDPLVPQYAAPNPQHPELFTRPEIVNFPLPPASARATDWTPSGRPFSDNRFLQAALRADVDLTDDVTLTSITSYIDFKLRQLAAGDGMSYVVFDNSENRGYIREFSQELRLANSSHNAFRWLLGGNFEGSNVAESSVLLFKDSTTNTAFNFATGEFRSLQKMRNYSAFANAEYDLTPQLTIRGGARYTEARRKSNNCAFDPGDGGINGFFTYLSRLLTGQNVPALGPGDCYSLRADFTPGPFNGELNENNVSWRAGVDYKVSKDVLLYANVARGYKAGSFPTLGSATHLQYAPVKQESVLSYEAGVKGSFLDRKLNATLAGFYYDYSNKQLKSSLIDPVFGILDALVNVPKTRVYGAELELNARPVRGLSAQFALVYTNASVRKFVGVNAAGVVADFAGANVPFTPKYQASANVDYEWDAGGGVRPFIGAGVSIRSDTVAILGGERVVKAGKYLYNMDGYALVDARLGASFGDGRWKVMAFGKNLTNSYYIQNVVTGGDVITKYPGRPRTYGIALSYQM